MEKSLLILGTFNNLKLDLPTQAYYLSELFKNTGKKVITVSHWKNKYLKGISYVLSILIYLKRYNVVIIQVYGGFIIPLSLLISFILKRILNKKVIMTIHGGSIPSVIAKKPKLMHNLFKYADSITAPSNFIKSEIEKFGYPVELIPNLIDFEDYSPSKKNSAGKPIILWMRAFHDVYDPLLAIEVFKHVLIKSPNAFMYMAGPNRGLKEETIKAIRKNKLEDKIDVLGYINVLEKKELFQKVDLYLCTNKIDNAPVTFLEMMYCRIPIVSVNIGGIPYLVENGKTALLAENRDKFCLAKCVNNITQNDDLYRKISHNAYDHIATNYSRKSISEKWDILLHQVS